MTLLMKSRPLLQRFRKPEENTENADRPIEQPSEAEADLWWGHWYDLMPDHEGHMPTLLGSVERPPPEQCTSSTTALFKDMFFEIPVGLDFSECRPFVDKLKPAVYCDLLDLVPATGLNRDGCREPIWSLFILRHELLALKDWAESPERAALWREWRNQYGIQVDRETAYSDPALDRLTREFLWNRKLGKAMTDLGIGMLMPTAGKPSVRNTDTDRPAYIKFEICLENSATHAKIMDNIHDLASALRVGWLRFESPAPNGLAVGHACLIHPQELTYPREINSSIRKEIAALDWQWWMAAAGLLGKDKVTTPKLENEKIIKRQADDPTTWVREMRFLLPEGLTANRVTAVTEELAAASKHPCVIVQKDDLPHYVTVLAGHEPFDQTELSAESND